MLASVVASVRRTSGAKRRTWRRVTALKKAKSHSFSYLVISIVIAASAHPWRSAHARLECARVRRAACRWRSRTPDSLQHELFRFLPHNSRTCEEGSLEDRWMIERVVREFQYASKRDTLHLRISSSLSLVILIFSLHAPALSRRRCVRPAAAMR